jgi:CBS domain-containing protein
VSRFRDWIDQGAPEDLLNASIYFDFRALAGRTELVAPLVAELRAGRAQAPRFMRQLAENALRNSVPLGWPGWLGAIDAATVEGRKVIDLKMNGTAIFVDAARLFALAHGLAATGTRERLQAAAPLLGVPAHEAEAWVTAFEFLQMLRLRVQLLQGARDGAQAHPNRLELDSLNDLDLRLLKETLRVARQLQQRMELDYLR